MDFAEGFVMNAINGILLCSLAEVSLRSFEIIFCLTTFFLIINYNMFMGEKQENIEKI